MTDLLRLQPDRMAHGGRAVARHQGQAVFIASAIPGDVVNVRVVKTGRRHLEAVVESVVTPSPHRIDPPCPYFGSCGGCQWQFAALEAQLGWKTEIVAGQLRHLASMDSEVRPTREVGPPYGYRNRVDLRVDNGRLALYRGGSHQLVPITNCLVLAPSLQAMMTAISAGKGELRGASRVTLRAGIRTGEELRLIDDQFGRIHEEVAGRRFRISGRAFFQNNTDGAEVLVDLVTRALAPQAGEMLLDGYAGGGLFAATVGMGCEVVAVESDPLTVTDLAFNTDAEILPGQLERVSGLPPHWDVAVVDPPRTGLGVEAVKVLVGGGPRTIAYVSCDPASFARDAALLDVSGYHLEWVQPLDLFPQTFHIEVVGKFVAR